MDGLLLGLVGILVTIRGHFYRSHLSGAHRARIYPRRAAAAHRSNFPVDVSIWRHGFESWSSPKALLASSARAVSENVATALFVMLQQLPLTGITSFVGIILVVVFFVTSSDSGSLVVDSLTSGGKLESPVPQRVFWAVLEGVVAAALLLGGGLSALQTAAISAGFPFAVMLLVMCFQHLQGAEL
jgi:hypothetical protein